MNELTLNSGVEVIQAGHLDPLDDGISSIQVIRIAGSDVDIVNAARVSFGKVVTTMSERDVQLVKYLIRHRHTSPLEHTLLSFRIKCPIYVARQWMRHRISSYNEISYRYVKSALEFYIPKHWRHQDKINRQASNGSFDDEALLARYKESLAQAGAAYEALLEAGVCREQARGLLPLCTYTEFIYTVNLHSFTHFLGLRLDAGAQWEIRRYAEGMMQLAVPHFPVSMGEFEKIWQEKQEAKV